MRYRILACAVGLIMTIAACNPTGPSESDEGEHSASGSEAGESGVQYRLSETVTETRSGVVLVIRYNAPQKAVHRNSDQHDERERLGCPR